MYLYVLSKLLWQLGARDQMPDHRIMRLRQDWFGLLQETEKQAIAWCMRFAINLMTSEVKQPMA